MNNQKEITVLCKVVDNFGDIGVVYRLSKQLFSINNELTINLIVDDLHSFNKICSDVDVNKSFQVVENLNVFNWNDYAFCYEQFSMDDGLKLSIILECFQCGRPDWMEKILFEDKLERTVQIIMIDYLTAEKYADDFHCLMSLTRSAKVQKVNFMPGFTEKTGGLVIDDEWKNLSEYSPKGPILVFTYERDWTPLSEALNETCDLNIRKILAAGGRGQNSFVEACKKISDGNKVEKLGFLNQNEWDKMMKQCSVLFIRGEESMSRACLSGIPFVWQAYPQSEEYQIVKVDALLERMSVHFNAEDFEIVRNVWRDINSPQSTENDERFKSSCTAFLRKAPDLVYGFKSFALSLRKNGDLALNLLNYIDKLNLN